MKLLLIVAAALLVSAVPAGAARVDCVSSVTGKYVSQKYAAAHRDSTVCKNRGYTRKYETKRR